MRNVQKEQQITSNLYQKVLIKLSLVIYNILHGNQCLQKYNIKIVDSGLHFSVLLYFSFFFFFFLFFSFLFLVQLGLGLSVMLSHQSQIDGVVTRLIMGLRRMEQKILKPSDVIQHGQHMLAPCYTHGHLGQGAQQLAQTMGNSI